MSSVRDAFFSEIYNQVKSGEDIYIITADLGAPSLDEFRRFFPDRYISSGIAEQNLIQIAVGMAWGGCSVIAYGLNPFPVTRAFDQIRCLMAEQKAPITLCCLNAGLCSAESGYTHMPIEDMAMLRTLSNIEIYNPSDETISRKLARETSDNKKPRIIRFDKSIKGELYRETLDLKKGFTVLNNPDEAKVGVITSGCYVGELYPMIQSYSDVKLIDVFRLPVDEDALVSEIIKCDSVITVEENVIIGGIGSMVLEILSDHDIKKRVRRMGLNMKKGYYDVYTDRSYIRRAQNTDIDSVMKAINDVLNQEKSIHEVHS